MKRLVTALAAGAAISTIAFASASVLGVDGSTIQHGQDGVSCDDGVNANWGLETDDNSVRSVRIDGIDLACAGDEMFVKVNDRRLPGKTIGTTGSESFPLSPHMTADEIGNVEIWIEG